MKYLPFLLLLTILLACGNSQQKLSNGTISNPKTGERIVTLDQTKNFGGLDVTIKNVMFTEEGVGVGILLANRTSETLTAYPNQGELIIGKSQYSNNMFLSQGDLGGEIYPGVEKIGVLAFPGDNIDTAAHRIQLRLKNVYGTNILRPTEIHFDLDLP